MRKITGKTHFYYLKKIVIFLIETITNKFSKNYSKIHLITDGVSWAVDTSTNDILRYFNKTKFKSKISLFTPNNQIVYYIDQYSILKNKFYDKKNIVAIDYQHGVVKFLKNHLKLLNFVKLHQKKIHLIRVTNSYFKSYLIRNGINKDKIYQIPIAVDTQKFKFLNNKKFFRKKFNLPQDKILIGSFHKDGEGWGNGEKPKMIKGPDVFVKTIKNLSDKIGRNKVFVVLTSPARGYVKKKLNQYKIPFKHYYPLEVKNIPLLFNCIDYYLVTSRDEGGPRGVFEAMACGVPVISTNVGHAHDHIKNNHNGFKSPIGDYKSLSKNILKLIKNSNLRKKIVKNSIKTAKLNNIKSHQHYWDDFKKKLIDFN
ncbi:glycosyltransferase family 4 protein [Candidatus Pelagibacter sp.]|nr:glycosyltransferase family 4 protein [Candidatus Pelagibacter sp.]